jgi:hypothetical protein
VKAEVAAMIELPKNSTRNTMSVKERLEKCVDVLPENRLRELLDFAEFLKFQVEGQPSARPGEDEAGTAWASGVAHEWSAELSDTREDIYTLDDGEPIHGRG